MVAQAEYIDDEEPVRTAAEEAIPHTEASIVPADSISGRALLAVIAIMTFLAALTLGAVVLVRSASGDWQSAVAREVSIQLRPTDGRDIEADLRRIVQIASQTEGIASARAYSKEESAAMLQPWLGAGLPLNELPIPRIVAVRVSSEATADFAGLRRQLAQLPGVSLDDHRVFVDRMRSTARSAVLIGLIVLGMVLAAAMMSVMFATRGAMAANRQIIEVLHVVGAQQGFIAAEFQRHFLLLGLKGGAIGGCAAMVLFALLGLSSTWFPGRGDIQVTALFGEASLGWEGYGAMIGLIILMAAVTAGIARLTVHRTLQAME
jgi:cell division transport system permease protein